MKAPCVGIATVLALLGATLSSAVAQESGRPNYEKLRYEEDWSFLRDPQRRTDLFDPLKFIAIGRETYLTLGGEIRERYEYTHNPTFGEDPQDRGGVFLQRYVLHGDLHLGRHLRLFGQLFSALENGRAGGPSPVDENDLVLQQAFVDLTMQLGETRLTLRPGRQELSYGSARLVDVREGPNVRRKFDGVRGIASGRGWRVDAFATYLAEDQRGVFDDGTDRDRSLWGVYGTAQLSHRLPGSIDLYYLGLRDAAGEAVQGTANERRHTVGGRLWGRSETGWDWNFEVAFQWGRFGSGDILAWTAASDMGYTFRALPWTPRLGLRADIASGDKDAADRDLQTFNPLFPRGNYFSELALLGPRNFFDVHPFVTLQPHRDVTVTGDVNVFWRESLYDGIYAVNGSVLRPPEGSRARFVGTQLSLNVEWAIADHLTFTAIYSHFFPGRFIKETGPAKDIDFVELTMTFTF